MAILRIAAGDSISYTVTIKNEDGSPYNLTGCDLWWTMKVSALVSDADAVVSAYWRHGGAFSMLTVANELTGQARLRVPGSETEGIRPVSYLYDLQLKDAIGDIHTIDTGTVEVGEQITMRVTIP